MIYVDDLTRGARGSWSLVRDPGGESWITCKTSVLLGFGGGIGRTPLNKNRWGKQQNMNKFEWLLGFFLSN